MLPSVDVYTPENDNPRLAIWFQMDDTRLSMKATEIMVQKTARLLSNLDPISPFNFIQFGFQIVRNETQIIANPEQETTQVSLIIPTRLKRWRWNIFGKQPRAISLRQFEHENDQVNTPVAIPIVRFFAHPDRLDELCDFDFKLPTTCGESENALYSARWNTLDEADVIFDLDC